MEEHRRQMQEDAQRWQKSAVRIVNSVRIGVLVLGALVVLCMVIVNLGIPKEVEENLPAWVITESGEALPCEISLRGEVTDYIAKKDKYGMDDRVKVWFGDRWLVEFEYYHGTFDYTVADAYWDGDTVEGLMTRDRDLVILALDVKMLFPEMASQRCVLVAPAENNVDALDMLESASSENLIPSLNWIEKSKG